MAWPKAVQLLNRLHMEKPERTLRGYPHQFSGGMRQRALIAMGVIADAKLLLADEPTKGLDRANIDRTARTFLELEGKTVLCVTHDLCFARRIADTITVMYAGQIVESSPTADFFQSPLHPYAQALVAVMPENGMTIRMGFAPVNAELSTIEHLKRLPDQLSGGELQRLAILRVLTVSPKLIILDEPTSMLDPISQAQILGILKELNRTAQITYLFITHDIDVANSFCNRIFCMESGTVRSIA